MRKVRALSAAAGAAALLLLAPLTASAAVAPHYSNNCATGRIESIANNLPIHILPYLDTEVLRTAQKGYKYDCTWQSEPIGDRYDACGHVGANAWIEIRLDNSWGYAYMVCVIDIPPGT